MILLKQINKKLHGTSILIKKIDIPLSYINPQYLQCLSFSEFVPMDEEKELIEEEELYELHYSDLMLVSEQLSQSQSQSRQIGEIMKALGPTGPGLLSITGVPNSTASLRRHLLSLARNLALLSPDHRLRILKVNLFPSSLILSISILVVSIGF